MDTSVPDLIAFPCVGFLQSVDFPTASGLGENSRKSLSIVLQANGKMVTHVTHGWYYFRCIPVAAPGSLRMTAKGSKFDVAFVKQFQHISNGLDQCKIKREMTADRHYFLEDPSIRRFLSQARSIRQTNPILILTSYVFCSSVALCFGLLFSKEGSIEKG